jgi:hypothetical protein
MLLRTMFESGNVDRAVFLSGSETLPVGGCHGYYCRKIVGLQATTMRLKIQLVALLIHCTVVAASMRRCICVLPCITHKMCQRSGGRRKHRGEIAAGGHRTSNSHNRQCTSRTHMATAMVTCDSLSLNLCLSTVPINGRKKIPE